MPRPKVHPDNRQRSVIACVPCKTAKIRCDSKTPCSTCVKRSREDKCVYDPPSNDGTARRKRRSTTTNTISSVEASKPVSNDVELTRTSSIDGDTSTNDESQGPRSRMLLSSKFQKGKKCTMSTKELSLTMSPKYTLVKLRLCLIYNLSDGLCSIALDSALSRRESSIILCWNRTFPPIVQMAQSRCLKMRNEHSHRPTWKE